MAAGESTPASSGLNSVAEWLGYVSVAPLLACLAGVGLLPDYGARELAQRFALAWGAVLLASSGAVHWDWRSPGGCRGRRRESAALSCPRPSRPPQWRWAASGDSRCWS